MDAYKQDKKWCCDNCGKCYPKEEKAETCCIEGVL